MERFVEKLGRLEHDQIILYENLKYKKEQEGSDNIKETLFSEYNREVVNMNSPQLCQQAQDLCKLEPDQISA